MFIFNMAQNFKTIQVSGNTKEEALAKAPFKIQFDATVAWKLAGKPVMGQALTDFCEEFLKKKTKFIPNVGASITLIPAVKDTREYPYTVIDIKNEKGKRTFKKAFQGVNAETGEILFTSFGTKSEAKEVAKALYNDGYKGDIKVDVVHRVVEGESGAFIVKYTPSKNATQGSYIVFGVEI